jgi:hypothetical protein
MTEQLMGVAPSSGGADADNLVGTWHLAAIEIRRESSDWAPAPMAGRPVGLLVYDARGNVAVQITTDPLPSEGNRGAFEFEDSYIAYYGTYDIDEATNTITHRRVAKNYTYDGDGDLVRRYVLDGDSLALTTVPVETFRLSWVRDC